MMTGYNVTVEARLTLLSQPIGGALAVEETTERQQANGCGARRGSVI
jgi:hypothetical protein